jgi:Sec-independent protein translocase protein TatA
VLLWVWIAVAVLALLVLGVLAHGLLGAMQRLTKELRATDTALRPVRAEVEQTLARVAAQRAGDGTSTSR